MKKGQSFFIIASILIFSGIFFLFFFFRDNIYVIKGDSMQPALYHGDLVITVKKPASKIIADEIDGDIIVINKGSVCYVEYGGAALFYENSGDHNIIHRVVDKKYINNSWFFLTKGDNNVYCDGGIREIFSEASGNYTLYEYNSSELVYISQNDILGVMIIKIPFVGLLRDFGWIFPSIALLIFSFILIMSLLKRKILIIKVKKRRKIYHSKMLIFLILLLVGQFMFQISMFNVYIMNNESMEPHLNYNDLLLLERKPATQIQVGDICIIRSPQYFYSHGFDPLWWNFYPNSSYLVHRILDKKSINGTIFFMTGGDKSPIHIDGMLYTLKKSDSYMLIEYNRSNIIYIPETEILGVVNAKIPFIGYLIDFMPFFSLILIAMILTVFTFLETKRTVRFSKKFN